MNQCIMDHLCIQSIINNKWKQRKKEKDFKLINKQIRLTKLEKQVSQKDNLVFAINLSWCDLNTQQRYKISIELNGQRIRESWEILYHLIMCVSNYFVSLSH